MERDGRSLDKKTLEEFRIRAVECLLSGESPDTISRILGVRISVVYKWKRMFDANGWDALRAKPIPGRPRMTSKEIESWLAEFIRSNNPQDLGFPMALWTREYVAEVLEEHHGVSLSLAAVGKLLHRIGFTPQRPMTRAYQQKPESVEQWISQDFPAISERAQKEGAEIFFGDEAGIRSDYHSGTTWAPMGKTPVVETTGQKIRLNMISAISGTGNIRFMIRDSKDGCVNSAVFITFLESLLVGASSKIFLVLDNASIHKSAETKKYVKSVSEKLELFFLPTYSPELNPDELVWNQVKNHTLGRMSFRTKSDLGEALHNAFDSLSKTPEKICSFFRKSSTSYALPNPV